MFGIPTNYLIAGALAAIALVGMFKDYLPSLGSLKSLVPKMKSAKPTRMTTLAALDQAYEFCKDKEYRDAIKAAIAHLYDQHAE
jgi:hypothetical protein